MDHSSAHVSASQQPNSARLRSPGPSPHADAPEPLPALQAVSLHDYEQLVTSRASFVDFLLGCGRDAA